MDNFWLNSKGELIEVNSSHNEYAYVVLEEDFGDLRKIRDFIDKNNCQYAYEVLHLRGWVRVRCGRQYSPKVQVLGNCIDLSKPMRNTIDPPMNAQQLKVVKGLCREYDTEFHVAINDKRFW